MVSRQYLRKKDISVADGMLLVVIDELAGSDVLEEV